MSKTHYRKVFKSDHLGVADLEDLLEAGSDLIFTIKQVKQEFNVSVAGKKGNFNIAYFDERIKPLVLNATNSKTLKLLSGGSSFVEDWQNLRVQLYIDANVKMKGDTVGGVRISPRPPRQQQEPAKPAISDERLSAAIGKINAGEYTTDRLYASFQLTSEQVEKVNNEVKE